jgi:3'-phosphoadenosine 5'-phosphosulfate sulfotransferase (PAPS reductase)/FAD synthetase
MQEALAKHKKIALSFSGGKDSLACVYLLLPHKDLITLYHMDTGDLLPETRAIVDHVRGFWPRFVHIQGNVDAWMAQHGMPTDLLPYGSHPIGRMFGQEGPALVPRYECCFTNLMWPVHQRIKSDGNTLVIRGTKRVDEKRLPADSGDTPDGVEILLPLRDWSHQQVFDYLRSVGAPINRIYEHVTNSPECARCPAWWNEKRAAYLREFHPALFHDYAARLRVVGAAISGPLGNLMRELQECGASQ